MILCCITPSARNGKPDFYFTTEDDPQSTISYLAKLARDGTVLIQTRLQRSQFVTDFQALTPDQEALYHLQAYEALIASLLQAQPL